MSEENATATYTTSQSVLMSRILEKNDKIATLQAENEALKVEIELAAGGMRALKNIFEKISDITGGVERNNWPKHRVTIQNLSASALLQINLLAPKSLTRQETLREVTKVFDKRKE